MISYWLFTFAGKNTNIGREKDQYFGRITKKNIFVILQRCWSLAKVKDQYEIIS